MKRLFFALAASCLLLTAGCGDDSTKVDPNAPIANQPGTALAGWTADQVAIASERCAAYGLLNSSNTRYNSWASFCACGYNAIAAVKDCTHQNYFSSNNWANYCIKNAQANITKCEQSAGLSNATYAEQSLATP